MYTVISVVKNKHGGEETAVSTGFANRGEASRFAVGLAKTGKTLRVDIREDPDPTLLETLFSWREQIKRTDAGLPEEVHRDVQFAADLDTVIAVLNGVGGVRALLTVVYNRACDGAYATTLSKAPLKYEFLEKVSEAMEAFEKVIEVEKEEEENP